MKNKLSGGGGILIYCVKRVDIYSLIYNTMAKIATKDRKTVRIAEKPPPPPPWGGCGVTGLGWCVSIMQCQSVWKASRNFRVSRGIWCFVASARFAWCVRNQDGILSFLCWREVIQGNLHVVSWLIRYLRGPFFMALLLVSLLDLTYPFGFQCMWRPRFAFSRCFFFFFDFTVYETKNFIYMATTTLFTHLKIILLQCFQFLVLATISLIQTDTCT